MKTKIYSSPIIFLLLVASFVAFSSTHAFAASDFGDAPAPYPVLLSEDGARHETTGPTLGSTRDSESDGTHSANADADGADEDGVSNWQNVQVGKLGVSVTVNVQGGAAKLDAWVDFNRDGSWGGPFERIADSVDLTTGNNTISFDVPSWADAGNTYARFRLSSAGALGVTGLASDGEVEDYQVNISSPAIGWHYFSAGTNITTSADSARSVFACDIDGDGDMDVLSASAGDDKIAWYENDGSQNFTIHNITTSADTAMSVFACDVDGDGDMDVLSASWNDDKITWYEQVGEPTVTTANVTNITDTSADCGGNVTDECHAAVTARGVCWNTNGTPTIADSHTTDGSGTGSFTSSITDLTSGGQTYYVRAYATNAEGTGYGEQKVFATSMTPPGNALSFDGANDYVKVTQNNGLPIYDNGTSNAYTICLWVKGGAQDDKRVFSEGSGSRDYPLFAIGTGMGSSDKLRVHIKDRYCDIQLDATSTSAVFDNTWHHVAWVDDNGTATLYIDGKADASDFNYTRGTSSTLDRTSIGAVLTSSPSSYFLGQIDDVSIWNVARSQSEIQNNMHKILNGDESNLVAYYHFDYTSGTALLDRTPNDNDGTLKNMTDDDWVTSTAPIGEDGTLVLTQTQTNIGDEGKQMQVTITTGGDASNYLGIYRTGDGDSPISDETFLGGVTQRSDILCGVVEYGEVTADLVFDYSNVPGITDPSAIQLLKRTDAASNWTNVTTDFTHDTGNRTFSKTGVTDYSEFSIGDGGDNSLPVELSSFTATSDCGKVILNWVTQTETNNIGFSLYRSDTEDGEYSKVAWLEGTGNTPFGTDYEYVDSSA